MKWMNFTVALFFFSYNLWQLESAVPSYNCCSTSLNTVVYTKCVLGYRRKSLGCN